MFDPENSINKLCAEGMQAEGEGKPEEAAKLFQQAWAKASTGLEKLTSAHYLARHQQTVAAKLEWDERALNIAKSHDDIAVKSVLPSLYLNVGKCYEDLHDYGPARENYQQALQYAEHLPADGYGNMIKAGIQNGITRVEQATHNKAQ